MQYDTMRLMWYYRCDMIDAMQYDRCDAIQYYFTLKIVLHNLAAEEGYAYS